MEDELQALIEPDDTTLRFSPAGLLLGARIDVAGSARYLRALAVKEPVDLAVPAALRQAHARIIQLHMHGLFDYGLFSLAEQAAWMFPESALGLRFVTWYEGRVPIEVNGDRALREVSDYRTVANLFARWPSASRRVNLDEPLMSDSKRFNGSFASLMAWGRATGVLRPWLDLRWAAAEPALRYALLTGGAGTYALPDDWNAYDDAQRTDWWAQFRAGRWEPDQLANLVDLRNLSAHQLPGHTVSPVQSAQAIVAAAVFTNALWEATSALP